MIGRLIILFSLFLCSFEFCIAQSSDSQLFSNFRKKTVATHDAMVVLDTLSIIPGSLQIPLDSTQYEVDFVNAILYLKKTITEPFITVSYRVFSRKLNAIAQRISYDSVMNYSIGKPYISPYLQLQNEPFFDFGNIQYSGTFGRGLSFGNSQDAVVSSNLNLQISGYLQDSIQIVAAITDNNIPIQPDGTTQQLNEFDRIFLQFSKRNWALSMGDIDIRKQASDYLQFYKRLQGMAFEMKSDLNPQMQNQFTVSGSIAKGKFTRNVFNGLEGNQGPYRLQGANNELFFVVLANTERVYIDGELLQRGEDQDYIINYNTAEITFMPKRMITRDKRIQVEFEYADRNYLNSNIYLADEFQVKDKLQLRVALFTNQDAKNSTINQSLDNQQKDFLRSIGKDPMMAFYPNATIEEYAPGKILYKKVDTTYNGVTDSIYVYSNNPDSAIYHLSFVDVGIGNGNYMPALDGTNGKVYHWVQPVNGIPQGQFEPAVFLITPKKQQVFSVGADYLLTGKTMFTTEWAWSDYDANTFSSVKGEQGLARKFKVQHEIPLKQKSKAFQTAVSWEKIDSTFKPVERLRPVEYTRDWGLPLTTSVQAKEEMVQASLGFRDSSRQQIKYEWTLYERNAFFKGIRHMVAHEMEWKGWSLQQLHMLSLVNDEFNNGYFFKPRIELKKNFNNLKNQQISFLYFKEDNRIRNEAADTILPYSFTIEHFQFGTQSNPGKMNVWGLNYSYRINHLPLSGELLRADNSHNVEVFLNLLANEYRQMRFTGTYRKLNADSKFNILQQIDESLLGRVEYQFNEIKGLLSGNLLYEVGAGQEQKRDFAFMEVPAGQGEYTWIDYNEDGIQQLNEFELALFQDQAKYIRIFTPTNEYIKANYNTLNYSLNINPRNLTGAQPEGFFSTMFSKLNLQSSLQLNKKETARGLVQLNPFKSPLGDSALITLNTILINTLSFNRFYQKWGVDITNAKNESKSLLTYGYETRLLNDWTFRVRWNVKKIINIEGISKIGLNQLRNDNTYFQNRNYDIAIHSYEPKLTYSPGMNWRIVGSYKFTEKQNRTGELEEAQIHSFNLESKVNWLQTTSIQAKLTYSSIDFMSKGGQANTTSSYIILDGLSAGKNYLWTIDLNKRLAKNLELSLQYEGRKPGENRTVHVGRASIRAIL